MVDKITVNRLKIIDLYRSNYSAQYHAREMARLTKKSHVTLLPHLHALEREKILIAKTMGKNKVYTLNLDNILARGYIGISELFASIFYQEQVFLIKKIATEISRQNFPCAFVLFGSYAKKTFKEDSDIDLFCLGTLKEAGIIKIKAIGRTYGKTINLKTASIQSLARGLRKKDALIMEILKYHIILQDQGFFINTIWGHYYEIRG